MERILSLLLLIFTGTILQAQSENIETVKNNSVSFGFNFPLGEFSETHGIGLRAGYSRSKLRLGRMRRKPTKPLGFILNAEVNYFLGKEEIILYTKYKYGNYLYLLTYCGIIYNSGNRGSINLTAGPFLGLYKNNPEAGFGLNLEGCYFIKSNIGISTVLQLLKHSDSNPLFTGGLKGVFVF